MAASPPDPSSAYSPKALEIIQRTSELLAAGGYNGFSYADIAALVDVRKASIHHHFPAKAALVKATVVHHRKAVLHGLRALDALTPDPLDRLVAYAGFWADCIQAANPPLCICALLAAELPSIPVEVAEEVTGHFNDLHAWVAATLDEGASSGVMRLAGTPAAEAAIFVAAIHGAMLTARALGDGALFRAIAMSATDRLRSA